MLALTTTSDVLQLITSAAGQIDTYAAYADVSGTTVTIGRQVQRISTATTTTVASAPGASTSRNVKRLAVANNSGSVTNTVTFQFFDGTNTIVFESYTLAPGERFSYSETAGIRVFDANGNQKDTTGAGTYGNANIADLGPGFTADTYLTGSSIQIGGRVKQGSMIKWKVTASKTAAGIAAAALAVRLGTAGAVGDTARATHTLAAATAAADAGVFEIDVNFRQVGASAVIESRLALYHQTAGFTTAGNVFNIATSAAFALGANDYIGLSLNAGTSAAWTIQQVLTDLENSIS
jgi:hypothetical protein